MKVLLICALLFINSCTVNEVVGPTKVSSMNYYPDPGMKEFYVEVSRREGVLQNFLLIVPPNPLASVILFMGGSGKVGVANYAYIMNTNFLVRNRNLFARHGLMVAVVDVPSDREGLGGFRYSQAHALDMKGVISFLRKHADIPVWLNGLSLISQTKRIRQNEYQLYKSYFAF